MPTVTLRFYAELNDFLAPARRQRDWTLDLAVLGPVRHLIETCGVPHTEVELIIRDGESIDLETSVEDGDRIAVYPMLETFDVRPLLRVRATPLRRLEFVADAHLGGLARRLRMLGFDTLWHNDLGDTELARLAGQEHRILLTRDRRLLMHRTVTHGCYLRAGTTRAQLADLVERLQLCAEIHPFSRCMVCNEPLLEVTPQTVWTRIPPKVQCTQQDFWTCAGCDRVYWKGSHWRAMSRQLAEICPGWGEFGNA